MPAPKATIVCIICSDTFEVPRWQRDNYRSCPKTSCRQASKHANAEHMRAARDLTPRIALCHPDRPHEAKGLCKPCYNTGFEKRNRERRNANAARWRKRNPEKIKKNRMKYLYGVADGQLEALMVEQDGLCAICRTAPATDVDHDHATGMVRGLLCGNCNRAIGLLNEKVETLTGAISYLKKGARTGEFQDDNEEQVAA